MVREEDYYWVKLKSLFGEKEWQPVKWENNTESWWIIGESLSCEEDRIIEIGERIIKK